MDFQFYFRGCDPNVSNNQGYTAIFLATKRGHLPIIQVLHLWKSSLGAEEHADAPIVLAARKGNPEIVQFLAFQTDNDDWWGFSFFS